jgi:hypothetical protein
LECVNGALDAPDKPLAVGAPLLEGEHVLVWAQVAGHPAWPARAPITWRTATSQVPVTFLGREGQTGRVSVAKLRPLMCADELAKAVAVRSQLRGDFEPRSNVHKKTRRRIPEIQRLAAALLLHLN